MVEYFQPNGRILEPCAGDGVFLKYLPTGTEWCEIEKGRDFFRWQEPVDWIVGNPPYKQTTAWVNHSFLLSKNFVYLLPADKPFISLPRMKAISKRGGIVHMRYYCDGPQMDMPEVHSPMAAIHFQRGYHGGMTMSYYEDDK
jgi:hypothetical protein